MNKFATAAFLLALAIILSVFRLSSSFKYRFDHDNLIAVTGHAEKGFKSDLVIWDARFNRQNMDRREAYQQLDQDEKIIHDYLLEKGLSPKEFTFSSVRIQDLFDYSYDKDGRRNRKFLGYQLNKSVQIESKRVDLVQNISREISELLEKNILLTSENPEFYYTQLDSLKINMLAEATSNATTRAMHIAQEAGSALGKMTNARMGVFQITGKNSSEEYTWGGVFNTSDKFKKASVTMKLNFKID